MLYSSNPDDIKLAAAIVSARQGGTEIVAHVVELLTILIDASTKLSNKIWEPIGRMGSITEKRLEYGEALTDLNDQIIRLSRETWVDPISMMTQAIGAQSLSKNLVSNEDINLAL